ncbi:ThiF family adenylyltransferase [Streptococcus equinus]|uniref:ThiF family adenylyltransferase n=1 Tax=Streptococcus equinus TaxID=1335 RepID=UPI003B596DC7
MKRPCFRPGIGVYLYKNELQIELFSVKKRMDLEADEVAVVVIGLLDGFHSIDEILEQAKIIDPNYNLENLQQLLESLSKLGLVYDAFVSSSLISQNYGREIDFLNSYPSMGKNYTQVFEQISKSRILVIGCGGLGSNIIENLARSGVRNITAYDNDLVNIENICNQSIFTMRDVGKYKVNVIGNFINSLNKDNNFIPCVKKVTKDNVDEIIQNFDFVFSCADSPSVKEVSSFVSNACLKYKIPHIVGGGYSGHRAALGMFVIPEKTACWNCYNSIEENTRISSREVIISPSNSMSAYPLINIVAGIQVLEFFSFYTNPNNLNLINSFSELYLHDLNVDKTIVSRECYNHDKEG